jgi:hypothetical protein
LALTLCGCETTNSLTGAPPLAVHLSAACERVLAPVQWPALKWLDSQHRVFDAADAFAKDELALKKAQDEIASGRACLAKERALYAAPAKKG